jgi:hypothetical protein
MYTRYVQSTAHETKEAAKYGSTNTYYSMVEHEMRWGLHCFATPLYFDGGRPEIFCAVRNYSGSTARFAHRQIVAGFRERPVTRGWELVI